MFDSIKIMLAVIFGLLAYGLSVVDDAETTSATATKRASHTLDDRYAACRKGPGLASGDWRVSCSKRVVSVSANATS